MKKCTLLLLTFVFAVCSFTSCSKSGKACKGGGWYGDRNLSFETTQPAAAEESSIYATPVELKEEICK